MIWYAPEQMAEQTIEKVVIWDAIALRRHYNGIILLDDIQLIMQLFTIFHYAPMFVNTCRRILQRMEHMLRN